MGEAAHIEQIRGLGVELARQYLWEVVIPNVPDMDGDAQQLTFRAMSTTVPDLVTEVFELQYKSTKVNWAGRDASAKTFDITFFDGEDFLVYKAMYGWLRYIETAPKSSYAKIITMLLLGRDDSAIMKVNLRNAFIENLQPLTLDYTVNDPINIPVTLRYDQLEIVE